VRGGAKKLSPSNGPPRSRSEGVAIGAAIMNGRTSATFIAFEASEMVVVVPVKMVLKVLAARRLAVLEQEVTVVGVLVVTEMLNGLADE
jgi:hypothetical protein